MEKLPPRPVGLAVGMRCGVTAKLCAPSFTTPFECTTYSPAGPSSITPSLHGCCGP